MGSLEHRRHKRYEVRDVKGSLLFRVQVKICNISVSGLAIETTERLKLGRTYSLRLANGQGSVDLNGTIRWCHLSGRRESSGGDSLPVYEAGLAFDEVFSEKAIALLRFLEAHVVLPLEKRITGRFRVETLDPVDLETRYDFEVLKLSLSGMLVRTQLEPVVGSKFGMEMRLKDSALPIHGRVAYVQRAATHPAEPLMELGVEFVDVEAPAREAITRFIAEELE